MRDHTIKIRVTNLLLVRHARFWAAYGQARYYAEL